MTAGSWQRADGMECGFIIRINSIANDPDYASSKKL